MEEAFDLRLRDKVEVQEISVDTSIEVDPALIKRVMDNLDRIEVLARLASDPDTWPEAWELAEELERELGVPVYIDENVDKKHPALIVNTERAKGSRVFCWLDLCDKRRVEFYEEVVYRFPA